MDMIEYIQLNLMCEVHKMKKILLFVSLLTLLFALCACSSSEHLHEYEVQDDASFEATCEKDGKTVYECKDKNGIKKSN